MSAKPIDFLSGPDPEIEVLQRFEQYRTQLIALFKKYDPKELYRVDATLADWQGKEEELLKSLHEKYVVPAEALESSKEGYERTIKALKEVYASSIRPLEELYKFDHFFSPFLEASDIEAKPMVLLLGSYSVGKTSFIRHIIGRDFPGCRIGPEPTTDRFITVMHGDHGTSNCLTTF